jgi:MFS family permease
LKPSLRAELARLIAGQVCLHACMTGLRMAAPLMALRTGHSPVAVGVLLALFALAQVFLALPAGRFADRHGLKKPLKLAVQLATVGAALAVVWPVYGVLCASALVCGAAMGLAIIALQRHAGQLASDATQLKQVFSWMAMGPSFSNFLGPFLAGLLIDAHGFRAAYLLLALLPSLAWLFVRRATEHARPEQVRPASSGSSWNLLSQPDFRRLMLVNWLLSSCWDVHTFLVPVLGHERGLSATAIGSILGAFALAATAIRVTLPWLASRLREAVVIACAMACTAVLFVLYPLAHAAWIMGGLSVLLGLTLGSVQPMIMSTLHQITPSHRHGEALALRSMAISASSVVMPVLFGTLGAVVGVGAVFWSVGAVVGVFAPGVWRYGSTHESWSLKSETPK